MPHAQSRRARKRALHRRLAPFFSTFVLVRDGVAEVGLSSREARVRFPLRLLPQLRAVLDLLASPSRADPVSVVDLDETPKAAAGAGAAPAAGPGRR